jgi:squalene-hopene/tetraprenyl-beta-curcumene cyclase
MPVGNTPSTAATQSLLHHFGLRPLDHISNLKSQISDHPWLLNQLDDSGGFRAFPQAPIPDLLSTGTALFALSLLSPSDLRPPTSDFSPSPSFIAERRGPSGGYTGHAFDTVEDVEYTYYALLALGSLQASSHSQISYPLSPHSPSTINHQPSTIPPSPLIHHQPSTIPPPSPLSLLESSLLAAYNPDRPWTGHLSSSAIATAVATFALHTVDPITHRAAIESGINWLLQTRNPDGGWGDTPDSPTNITATHLTLFSLHAISPTSHASPLTSHASIPQSLRARYGSDNTFFVPILTMGALSGYLGSSPWSMVPQLPFELAACPTRWFRLLNIGVVSYALPALIAIGLVRHKHSPTRFPPLRKLRDLLTPRLLSIAHSMQPSNGGYEEATPLTGFVTMSLAAAGFRDHPIVHRGVSFLLSSQRPDGSWPIDTDLATWVTSHAICALTEPSATSPSTPNHQPLTINHSSPPLPPLTSWLLAQQHTARHPLTGGAPGGWGWTNLPGAMPDADDTAGVLLALHRLGPPTPETLSAVSAAVQWLLDLQNYDGGIPTFCRGWGKLPFDRSAPDLTAHTLEAFAVWHSSLPPAQRTVTTRAINRMIRYLAKTQSPDGSWLALWFGTQVSSPGRATSPREPSSIQSNIFSRYPFNLGRATSPREPSSQDDESNPVYGTARTVLALARTIPSISSPSPTLTTLMKKGRAYLLHAQHPSGGWAARPGLTPTIEETAMALSAMAGSPHHDSIQRGTDALLTLTKSGAHTPASPIGLYFARLWYSEKLYPLLFTITALRRVATTNR